MAIEIVDFADNTRALAALAGGLVNEGPPRVRLTYRFGPVDMGAESIPSPKRYQCRVYSGCSQPYSRFPPRCAGDDPAQPRRTPRRTPREP